MNRACGQRRWSRLRVFGGRGGVENATTPNHPAEKRKRATCGHLLSGKGRLKDCGQESGTHRGSKVFEDGKGKEDTMVLPRTRRMVFAGSVVAITATGSWVGAGLKTNQQQRQVYISLPILSSPLYYPLHLGKHSYR